MTNTTPSSAKRARIALPFCAALLAVMAGAGAAQDLALPAGADRSAQVARQIGAYDLPIAPWHEDRGVAKRRFEGRVLVQAWRIEGSGLTLLQLIDPLREQLANADFQILLDCIDRACGGFDFHFDTLVLPAPEMFVDLSDFHAISAVSPDGRAVALLASRDATSAYLQIIRAGGEGPFPGETTDAALPGLPHPLPDTAQGPIDLQLEETGHAVLRDMRFASGASALTPGPVDSLDQLAAYLRQNPTRRVMFVGHTDATGSLEANQRVSLQRARAAVTYLRDRHDIPADQISAEGAGFLAPLASNLTEAGRRLNRRVEAVLISTE
jgi:OOP family OmpA-OmpF porin